MDIISRIFYFVRRDLFLLIPGIRAELLDELQTLKIFLSRLCSDRNPGENQRFDLTSCLYPAPTINFARQYPFLKETVYVYRPAEIALLMNCSTPLGMCA